MYHVVPQQGVASLLCRGLAFHRHFPIAEIESLLASERGLGLGLGSLLASEQGGRLRVSEAWVWG